MKSSCWVTELLFLQPAIVAYETCARTYTW